MIRIQRKRSKGWRMPADAKYVGRPSRLGNPFVDGSASERVSEFRRAFYAGELLIDEEFVRSELTGFQAVCCWCREEEPCHADLFVEIMNAGQPVTEQDLAVREIPRQENLSISVDLLPLAEGVGRSIEDSRSANTSRALRTRWASFCNWAEPRGFSTLPAEPFVVSLYAEALDRDGKSLATILAYVSAIATVHKDRGLDNPCANHGVREYISGKRRQHAPRQQRQASALSDDDRQAVLVSLYRRRRGRGGHVETQEHADSRALVDEALLLSMTQAGLRRSEAAALTWGDISEYRDGTGRILVASGKTDQTGKGAVVAVKRDCIRALLAIRPQDATPVESVFRLSGAQISRRLKAMCAAAGIDTNRISGHTPRVSLARGMSEKGAPTHLIQRQGRWSSTSMVVSYTREATAAETLGWL